MIRESTLFKRGIVGERSWGKGTHQGGGSGWAHLDSWVR